VGQKSAPDIRGPWICAAVEGHGHGWRPVDLQWTASLQQQSLWQVLYMGWATLRPEQVVLEYVEQLGELR
jgi:hypothetical protein